MIRSLTLTGHGLQRARRHLGTVLLVYLASLIPSLLVVSLVSADLAPALDESLFAERLLGGEGFGVWVDFQRSESSDLQPIASVLLWRFGLVVLLQILVAAGLVEVLLERAGAEERPFLAGVGRHGFRFVRSALVFGLVLAIVLALTAPLRMAFEESSGTVALIGMLVYGLVVFLLYMLADLAYDFSRISAAAHGQGRMFVGFFKTLGFVFHHLLVLVPLYLLFTVLVAGLQILTVALRSGWTVDTPGEVLGWLLAQQAVFFAVALLRTALWGAEVTYFQGIGEPRWCGRRESEPAAKELRRPPRPSAVRPAAVPEPAPPPRRPAAATGPEPPLDRESEGMPKTGTTESPEAASQPGLPDSGGGSGSLLDRDLDGDRS